MPVTVNRAPVLTLWVAVVAERLGHPPDTALTLGRAVAGSATRVKARNLGREERKADRPIAMPTGPSLSASTRQVSTRVGSGQLGKRRLQPLPLQTNLTGVLLSSSTVPAKAALALWPTCSCDKSPAAAIVVRTIAVMSVVKP